MACKDRGINCGNKYTTLLDLARQAKILSGETACFEGGVQVGIPFSGYPSGVDYATVGSLGIVSSQNAVINTTGSGTGQTTTFDVANRGGPNFDPLFSAYSYTCLFTALSGDTCLGVTGFTKDGGTYWSNPLFSGGTSELILPITNLSATTQTIGPFWTITQTGCTGDHTIATQYTGYTLQYSFFNVYPYDCEEFGCVFTALSGDTCSADPGLGTGYSYLITGFTTCFSGFTTGTQENFSASTLDYRGPLTYLHSLEDALIDNRTVTTKLRVTGGASASTLGYVLTQVDDIGTAEWRFNSASASTNTFVTSGLLNGSDQLELTYNTGGSVPPIDLSSLSGDPWNLQSVLDEGTTPPSFPPYSSSDSVGILSGDSIVIGTGDPLGSPPISPTTLLWLNQIKGTVSLAAHHMVSDADDGAVQITAENNYGESTIKVSGGEIDISTTGSTILLEANGNILIDGLGELTSPTIGDVLSAKDVSGRLKWETPYSFTGGTGSCITDLYVTNIHGCSPITVHDPIQHISSSATGVNSIAWGTGTTASGYASHAEGANSKAYGDVSHAEGVSTAEGEGSHSEGSGYASGTTSHAEGDTTLAGGTGSHAEGGETKSFGDFSHVEGKGSMSYGYAAHAEGSFTIASGDFSHAEGSGSTASGIGSHSEANSSAIGPGSHSEGNRTISSGNFSHSEGTDTIASGNYAHTEGCGVIAAGNCSHAGGESHSLTNSIIASGKTSFVHFHQSDASGIIGAYGDYTAILGGADHNIGDGSTNSTIIGGSNNTILEDSINSGIFVGSGNTINDDIGSSVIIGGIYNNIEVVSGSSCGCPCDYEYDTVSELCIQLTASTSTAAGPIFNATQNGVYTQYGARFCLPHTLGSPSNPKGSCGQGADVNDYFATQIVPSAFWGCIGCTAAPFNGRLNAVGINNAAMESGSSDFYGFSECVNLPSDGQYLFAMAGDNQIRAYINGKLVIENPWDGTDDDDHNFKIWWVFTVDLNAGGNVINIEGANEPPGTSAASFGCEIVGPFPYDTFTTNTDFHIFTGTTGINTYTANTVFSSVEKVGSVFDTEANECPPDFVFDGCISGCVKTLDCSGGASSIIAGGQDNTIYGTSPNSGIFGGNSGFIEGSREGAIIGGCSNYLDESSRSVIIGGQNITGVTEDTAYVPNLNIDYQPDNDNTLSQLLVRDETTGTVKYRDASSISGGGGSFTGNTPGDCINELWVANISGCTGEDLHIGASGGDIYFDYTGDTSTPNLFIERDGLIGIGTNTPFSGTWNGTPAGIEIQMPALNDNIALAFSETGSRRFYFVTDFATTFEPVHIYGGAGPSTTPLLTFYTNDSGGVGGGRIGMGTVQPTGSFHISLRGDVADQVKYPDETNIVINNTSTGWTGATSDTPNSSAFRFDHLASEKPGGLINSVRQQEWDSGIYSTNLELWNASGGTLQKRIEIEASWNTNIFGDIAVKNTGLFYTELNRSFGPLMGISGGTDDLVQVAAQIPGSEGMSMGSRGSTAGIATDGYGKQSDGFIYSSSAQNGLNIISQDGGGAQEDYIRFYAGQDASASPCDMIIVGTGAPRGFVGVGTESPEEKLHVDDGNILATWNQDATSSIGVENLSDGVDARASLHVISLGEGVVNSGIFASFGTGYTGTGTFKGDYLPHSLTLTTGGGNSTKRADINIGTRRDDGQIRFFTGGDNFTTDTLLGVWDGGGLTLSGTNNTMLPATPVTDFHLNTDTIQVRDGATIGYVLTATDSLGNASWQPSSGGGTFTGNTSGTCIDLLWVSTISGCSPVTIGSSIQSDGSTASGFGSIAYGVNTLAMGNGSHAEGHDTIATGLTSHAEGNITMASGDYSHAEGANTFARGEASHAEGEGSVTDGDFAHAEGQGTWAIGEYSHTEGSGSIARGESSHAEGDNTSASGITAHAEGTETKSWGDYSHSEGFNTLARGMGSHAEGGYIEDDGPLSIGTSAKGDSSHAEGYGTLAMGNASHAEGWKTIAGPASVAHAEGYETVASGSTSHAEGYQTIASGELGCHAEGYLTEATDDSAHAEGQTTEASAEAAHAEGISTTASGQASHAEGNGTTASGTDSHAEGVDTLASNTASHAEGGFWGEGGAMGTLSTGLSSHAEGCSTDASGDGAHAEGFGTTAAGESSHAEGSNTTASASGSHAEGDNSIASGLRSHAQGYYTIASGLNSHSMGALTIASGDHSYAGGKGGNGSTQIVASGDTSFAHYRKPLPLGGPIGVWGDDSVILGGINHDIGVGNDRSTIIGGDDNILMEQGSSGGNLIILGGEGNIMNISSGHKNNAILGGLDNSIGSLAGVRTSDSVVVGGLNNVIQGTGIGNAIIGGDGNTVGTPSGFIYNSVIIGGTGITATDDNTVYMPNVNLCVYSGALYSNTIIPCSPLTISPGNEGNVHLGEQGGAPIITLDILTADEPGILIGEDSFIRWKELEQKLVIGEKETGGKVVIEVEGDEILDVEKGKTKLIEGDFETEDGNIIVKSGNSKTLVIEGLPGVPGADLSTDIDGKIIDEPSDSRVKENRHPLHTVVNVLEFIKNVKGYQFTWSKDSRIGDPNIKHYGFMVDHFRDDLVDPAGQNFSSDHLTCNEIGKSMVRPNRTKFKIAGNSQPQQVDSLSYTEMIPFIVEGLKAVDFKVENLTLGSLGADVFLDKGEYDDGNKTIVLTLNDPASTEIVIPVEDLVNTNNYVSKANLLNDVLTLEREGLSDLNVDLASLKYNPEVRKYVETLVIQNNTPTTINHNLNDEDVIVQVQNDIGELIIPDKIQKYQSNSVDIEVSITGKYKIIILR